jgi:Asp-tRNA(Asn)/Glu-tRNA(Gln) amidotransferase C subunit
MSEHWERLKDEDPDTHQVLQKVAAAAFQLKIEPVPLDAVDADTEKIEETDFLEIEEVEFEQEEKTCVSFSAGDMRVEYISRHAAEMIVEDWDDPVAFADSFSNVQHRTTRLGVRAEATKEVLRLLSSAYGKDVVSKTAEIAEIDNHQGRHPLWEVFPALCNALPKLDVEAVQLAESLGPMLEVVSGDAAGGSIYRAIREIASESQEKAEELFAAFIDREESPVISLASNALLGLSSHDLEEAHERALELTRSDTPVITRIGIDVLGKLDYSGDEDLMTSSMERLADLKEGTDPEIDYVIARAYGNLVDQTDEAKEALIELSSRPDPRTHRHISKALYSLDDPFGEAWYQKVLAQLAGAGLDDPTAIENLDVHISQLVEESPGTVVEVLEEFVLSSTDGSVLTDVFDSSVSKLLETHFAELEKAITQWFASTDSRLHRAAAGLADHHFHATAGEENPVFALSEDLLGDLDTEEVVGLLRRIVGYVSGSRNLASLVSSALRRDPCPEELQRFVGELLVGHVLYNYPGEAREHLEHRLESDDVTEVEQEIIQEAFDEIDEYFDQLDELSTLKELRPPSSHLSKIRRARKQQQSKAMEKAREGSVIQSLFQSVPLKYGSGFYQINDEGSTEPAPLNKISTEFEIPRGELIDPVGQAYKRFLFSKAHSLDQQSEDDSGGNS